MITPRFEIRPLNGDRPVPPAERQSAARFRASWADTIDLLLYEVQRLDGGLIVVQVDAPPSEIRRDGMLYARARVATPAVKISFDSRHGPLTYATDEYDHWQANVRAIALALQALRAVDRYGVTKSGEQYRGWSQITAAPAENAMTVDEAARVLADAAGISPSTLERANQVIADAASPGRIVAESSVRECKTVISNAYRAAAKTAHPDAGGNADVFRLITTARDVLFDPGAVFGSGEPAKAGDA